MAYGTFSTGSGASTYDLDMLAAEFISGCVKAPLTTIDGTVIATQKGKQIVANTVQQKQVHDDAALTSAVAGIVRMIEILHSEHLVDRYTLATNIIRGNVSAPLMTADGKQLRLSGGEPLLAHKIEEDEKSYTNMAIAKAFKELLTSLDWYYSQNFAAIQSIIAERYNFVTDFIRGIISVPLMTADEEQIYLSNGKPLFAYRVKEDEKAYTNKAVAKAVTEFYTIVDWYQAQNLKAMQSLAADIIRGNVSASLITDSGNPIYLDNDKPLLAYKVKEDEKFYTDKAIVKAFTELSATVEQYQAQNMAAMQSLIISLMSGQVTVPLTNAEGTAVITHSGVDIKAVKNL